MEIKILTPEESLEYYNTVKAENALLTREQVQHWAKSLPKGMQGNTDYINGPEKWKEFYEWILTDEGYAKWKETLDIVTYIRDWSGFPTELYNEAIKNIKEQNGETTEI
jgi:hypothetical protein